MRKKREREAQELEAGLIRLDLLFLVFNVVYWMAYGGHFILQTQAIASNNEEY